MFDFFSRLKDVTIFQGSLNNKNYFEGWYFKQTSLDGKNKFAVIPGISLSGSHEHAFIQVYDGTSGVSNYVSYNLEEFTPKKDPFSVKLGNSVFKLTGIELDIPEFGIEGALRYSDHSYYNSRWFERGVMGLYGYVPFMETYHGLISLDHKVQGTMNISGKDHFFDKGRGYIEKDWGKSFPSSWIWMQSNDFLKPKTSLMVSVAIIPWLNSSFVGHIAVLLFDNKILNLSTYRGGKITLLQKEKDGVRLKIESRKFCLEIKALKGESVSLRSPIRGEMKGRTIESLSGIIEVRLVSKQDDEILFSGTGSNAGLEIMDENSDLIKKLGL
jgi:hypothetical protein